MVLFEGLLCLEPRKTPNSEIPFCPGKRHHSPLAFDLENDTVVHLFSPVRGLGNDSQRSRPGPKLHPIPVRFLQHLFLPNPATNGSRCGADHHCICPAGTESRATLGGSLLTQPLQMSFGRQELHLRPRGTCALALWPGEAGRYLQRQQIYSFSHIASAGG